jgi:tRNA (mo5U34)-methyltransferase
VELQQRIDAFPAWHYQFEFEGAKTPILRPDFVNRHEQRRRLFFDPLLAINGGSLTGLRVLDLGCNAGFWSLLAVEAGAEFVLGIDGRQVNIDQASLVFEAKGIAPERYRFELGNIFEHDLHEQFDVVLCLGLMYHIGKPLELFEVMAKANPQILVIDTFVSLLPLSAFRVVQEDDLDNPLNAVDYDTLLIPTRGAVLDLARQFGFEGVPLAHDFTDHAGMADYRSKQRAAFLCSKGIPLDGLAAERIGALTLLRAVAEKRVRSEVRRALRVLLRR